VSGEGKEGNIKKGQSDFSSRGWKGKTGQKKGKGDAEIQPLISSSLKSVISG